MRTLVALVMTILNMLYTVGCVQIQFRCPFLIIKIYRRRFDFSAILRISPVGIVVAEAWTEACMSMLMYVDVKCHIQAPSRFGGEPHSYPHFKK